MFGPEGVMPGREIGKRITSAGGGFGPPDSAGVGVAHHDCNSRNGGAGRVGDGAEKASAVSSKEGNREEEDQEGTMHDHVLEKHIATLLQLIVNWELLKKSENSEIRLALPPARPYSLS
jgi:hypothetical protein